MPNEKHESALKFLKTSIAGSILTVVRVGTGFGRAKISALVLGTAGVGLMAQGNQLMLLAGVLGSFSLAGGLVNQLANPDHVGKPELRQSYLSTVFSVQIVLSLALVLVTVVGARVVSELTFGNPNEGFKCVLVVAAIPFSVLSTTGYFEGILFAAHRYDLYARALIGAAVIGLVSFLTLVYWWGLNGAFVSIPLIAAVTFFLLAMAVGQVEPIRNVFTFKVDFQALRRLLAFSGTILPTAVIGYGAMLLIRRQVLTTLGAEANGILQVPLTITSYYTPLITQALWGRLHPAVSSKGNTPAASEELVTVLRIVAILSTVMVVGIITCGELMVRVVYSKAFGSASELLVPQLLGDYWYLLGLTVSVYFLGTARLKTYMAGWVAYYLIYIGTTLTYLKSLEILAIPVGYLVSGFVMALAALFWVARSHPCKSTHQTLAIIALGVSIIVIQSAVVTFSPGFAFRLIVPAGCAALMAHRVWRRGLQGLLTA